MIFLKKLIKKKPINVIKFNCANEVSFNLFKKKIISFTDIHKIIEKSLSINFNSHVNNIESIIEFNKEFTTKINEKLKF